MLCADFTNQNGKEWCALVATDARADAVTLRSSDSNRTDADAAAAGVDCTFIRTSL